MATSDGIRLETQLPRLREAKKIYEERASEMLAGHCASGHAYQERIWPCTSRVRRVANGIPDRVDRLRAIGNAVDPRQIYPILQAIYDLETLRHGQVRDK